MAGPVFQILLYDGASRWIADAVAVWLGPGIPPVPGTTLARLFAEQRSVRLAITLAEDPPLPAIPAPFPADAPSQPPQVTDRPPPPMPPVLF